MRSDDLNYLVSKVQKFCKELVKSRNYETRLELLHDLESYGYKVIMEQKIEKHEVGYLKGAMRRGMTDLLKKAHTRIDRFINYAEDVSVPFDCTDECEEEELKLEKLTRAGYQLTISQLTHVLNVIQAILDKEVSPTQEAANKSNTGIEAVRLALRKWRKHYGEKSEKEVSTVRTLSRLRSLLSYRLLFLKAGDTICRDKPLKVRLNKKIVPGPRWKTTSKKSEKSRSSKRKIH